MTITYVVGNGLYVNLTNSCSNSCDFCIRQYGPTVYGSGNLWLEREPLADEVIEHLKIYDLDFYDELVFCGYGEPTERLDTLLTVARAVRARSDIPIRINTNGHGNLINCRDITPDFEGLIDVLSISLNAANAEDYVRICHPEFGAAAYEGLLEFARLAVPRVKRVVLSVVETTLSDSDIEKCRAMAESIGAELRVRPFE